MKKSLLYHFLFIAALGGMSTSWAMVTTTRRTPPKKLLPKPVYTQKTIYHTQPHQPLTWKESLKQSYLRFKQLLWGPGKARSEVVDEIQSAVNVILNKFNNKDPNFSQDLKEFLKEADQETVDTFLNKFVFSGGLTEFNELVFWLFKEDKIIRNKITHWTQDNITKLFILDIPTDDQEFFLYTLLRRFHNRKLIQSIRDNFVSINQKPSGKKFINLLRRKNISLYNEIAPDNEKVLAAIKESITKQENDLITRE